MPAFFGRRHIYIHLKEVYLNCEICLHFFDVQASASCDGTVRVWNITDQKQVKTINGLPKSNDVAVSKTLCRLTWDLKGKVSHVSI
jgi:WD40 repeat protein